MSDHMLK
jgi:hypothetical protein